MRVLVVLTLALLPLSLLKSTSCNSYESSSNAHEQPNDGTADGLTEEVIKKKREELLTHLLEGIEEGARTKTEFSDPLEAVNYAKEQELRREKESLRSGNRRVRRSVPKFKPPSPYAIINDSEDGKKPDNFLLETLPQNLLEVKQGTYIHFRICPKPVVPEEV
ncbi:unnamed protein product [Dibothriocephalus latus]|uniref:Uncharacterized protein n=1 Tax=Dibothriocephalus latus TaxID=60516 RepID=A0A3P7M094_DIBLA|nr:unnamed protein product [Dibothriocephalus latus]